VAGYLSAWIIVGIAGSLPTGAIRSGPYARVAERRRARLSGFLESVKHGRSARANRRPGMIAR